MAMKCPGIAECGRCLEACPKGAIAQGRIAQNPVTRSEIRHIHIDRAICDNCGECVKACFRKALYLCGSDYTVEDLLQRVCKDIPFYQHSGGGVTISGGEPLCQPEFLLQFLRALKGRGIHTAVDTTGCARYGVIEPLLPFTDLFLYDLKHMDPEQHRIVLGVDNGEILENARRIAAAGNKIQIRIPLIPRFNDSEENLLETGRFCKSLGAAVSVIQLLPYHNLGVMKHQRIDDSRTVLEAVPPSDEKVNSIRKLLEAAGLPVTVH
jgi:pyruvate formate lyase activating enzyme